MGQVGLLFIKRSLLIKNRKEIHYENIADLFTCKDCGGHQLEEIMDEAHVCSEVLAVDEESGELEYGPMSAEEAGYPVYQCKTCGNIVGSHSKLCALLQIEVDDDFDERD